MGERSSIDIVIEQYTGSHRDLAWSFREAGDSPELLDAYIDLGRLWVARAAGAADVGNLRFCQRCGFRMTHVVQDVFTPEDGYPPGLEVDGIPLRDQVWLERLI